MFIRFLTLLFLLHIPLYSQTTVAINDFENRTGKFYLDEWESRIPEFLKSELSRSRKLTIVERQNLKAILQEKALSLAGLTDTAAVQEVGKLLGAQYVITGSISEVGARYRIDAHIINVASGKVISEKVISPDTKYLNEMVEVLGNNLRYQLTGEGKYRTKKSLKKYPTTIALLGTAVSVTAAVLVHRRFLGKQDDYRAATALQDFDPLYHSANRLNKARYILAGVAGTGALLTLYFWMKNLSPDEVLAGSPPVMPYVSGIDRGDFRVGVHIDF